MARNLEFDTTEDGACHDGRGPELQTGGSILAECERALQCRQRLEPSSLAVKLGRQLIHDDICFGVEKLEQASLVITQRIKIEVCHDVRIAAVPAQRPSRHCSPAWNRDAITGFFTFGFFGNTNSSLIISPRFQNHRSDASSVLV